MVKYSLKFAFEFDGEIEVSEPNNLTFDYDVVRWDRVDILLKVDETIVSTLGELKRKGPDDRWLFYGQGESKELEQEFMESFYKIYDDYVSMIPDLAAHDNKIRTVSYKLYETGLKEAESDDDKPVDK